MLGSYEINVQVGKLPQKVASYFDETMGKLLGAVYTPVAYLGSQIVAGQNHCFLARATVVYPGAQPYYALVFIYESLDGQTKITNIAELDIAAYAQPEEVISED